LEGLRKRLPGSRINSAPTESTLSPAPERPRSCNECHFDQYGTSPSACAALLSGLDTGKAREHTAERLPTVTLGEALARAGAPRMLDFVSLDVEGAEHLALTGLLGPDSNHSARLIGVERPNAAARALLEAAGFVRIATLSAETDQFWAHFSLPNFPAVLAARAALAALPAARRHALSAYERWARAAALGNPPNPQRALREPPAGGATPAPFPVALIAPREGASDLAATRPCRVSDSCLGRAAPRCTRPHV
jgi:hypothetical protein